MCCPQRTRVLVAPAVPRVPGPSALRLRILRLIFGQMPRIGARMVRNRTLLPAPSRVRRARPVISGVATMLAAVALVIMALWYADDSKRTLPSWPYPAPAAVVGWLVQQSTSVLSGLGHLISGASGGPARAEFIILGLVALFALRRWRFACLAARPGPIQVLAFDGPSTGNLRQAGDLTAKFRTHLSSVALFAPTLVPGDAVPTTFLQLVKEGSEKHKSVWSFLADLAVRMIPNAAYQVRGTLHQRAGNKPCGVYVELSVMPRGTTISHEVWEDTWAEVAVTAAYIIAAAILPSTRLCRKPPWRKWKGLTIPPKLLQAYETAKQLTMEERFDEALLELHTARDLDPLNPHLLLEVAKLQERLDLPLDALASYDAAITSWAASPDEHTRWINRRQGFAGRLTGFPGWIRYTWKIAINGSPFTMRYRYALRLGLFEQLAEQWCKVSGQPVRLKERARLRELLGDHLADRYWPGEAHARTALLELRRRQDVESMFANAGQRELESLRRDFGWLRRLCVPDELSGPALAICSDVWAPLRVAWAQERANPGCHWAASVLDSKRARKWLRRKHWKERVGLQGEWLENYNRACVFAIGLNDKRVAPARRQHWVDQALDSLSRATARARGSAVTSQRSWTLLEDPDLVELRRHEEFRRLAAQLGPRQFEALSLVPRVHVVEIAGYVPRLIEQGATLQEERWIRRAAMAATAPTPDLEAWLEQDFRAWFELYELTRAYRHWPQRAQYVRFLRANLSQTLEVEMPELDGRVPRDPNCADRWATAYVRRQDGLLERLTDQLNQSRREMNTKLLIDGSGGLWRSELQRRRLGVEGAFDATLAGDRCRQRAASWRCLREYMQGGCKSPAVFAGREMCCKFGQTSAQGSDT